MISAVDFNCLIFTGDKDVDFQEIKGKKIMGIGLGNIFQGGPIKLRNTAKKPDPGKGKPEEKVSTATCIFCFCLLKNMFVAFFSLHDSTHLYNSQVF